MDELKKILLNESGNARESEEGTKNENEEYTFSEENMKVMFERFMEKILHKKECNLTETILDIESDVIIAEMTEECLTKRGTVDMDKVNKRYRENPGTVPVRELGSKQTEVLNGNNLTITPILEESPEVAVSLNIYMNRIITGILLNPIISTLMVIVSLGLFNIITSGSIKGNVVNLLFDNPIGFAFGSSKLSVMIGFMLIAGKVRHRTIRNQKEIYNSISKMVVFQNRGETVTITMPKLYLNEMLKSLFSNINKSLRFNIISNTLGINALISLLFEGYGDLTKILVAIVIVIVSQVILFAHTSMTIVQTSDRLGIDFEDPLMLDELIDEGALIIKSYAMSRN